MSCFGRSCYTVFTLAILLSVTVAQAQDAISSRQQRIRDAVQKIAKRQNIPSLEIAVRDNQNTYQIAHHHPETAPQATYGIGSTTKILSSVLVMSLVEKGVIDLDGRVDQIITDPQLSEIQDAGALTIRHLLQHKSGLSDYANNPEWMKRVFENDAPKSFRDKLKLVKPTLESKGRFVYCNTNYLLLEKVVESATGRQFDDVFNGFYRDLGLKISLSIPDGNLQAFFAQTSKGSGDVSRLDEHYGYDGGVYTTPVELQRFLTKLYIDRSILTDESIRQMHQWSTMAPREIPIGQGKLAEYGLGVMKLTYGDTTSWGHAGGTLKYQSFAFYCPENQSIVVVATNCSGRHYNNVFFQELLPAVLNEW